jgi:hypothetical protein
MGRGVSRATMLAACTHLHDAAREPSAFRAMGPVRPASLFWQAGPERDEFRDLAGCVRARFPADDFRARLDANRFCALRPDTGPRLGNFRRACRSSVGGPGNSCQKSMIGDHPRIFTAFGIVPCQHKEGSACAHSETCAASRKITVLCAIDSLRVQAWFCDVVTVPRRRGNVSCRGHLCPLSTDACGSMCSLHSMARDRGIPIAATR